MFQNFFKNPTEQQQKQRHLNETTTITKQQHLKITKHLQKQRHLKTTTTTTVCVTYLSNKARVHQRVQTDRQTHGDIVERRQNLSTIPVDRFEDQTHMAVGMWEWGERGHYLVDRNLENNRCANFR